MTGDPREDGLLWATLFRDLGVESVPSPPAAARPAGTEPAAAERAAPGAAVPAGASPRATDFALRDLALAADPAAALQALRVEVIGDCRRCGLCEGRTNVVFGVGHPRARLMFVGEGPGADEDAQGEPFVGRAGQLLDRIIAAMGLSRPEVYIGNVVKCRPPGNRTPLPDEAATCLPFLRTQIAIVKPEVIVALGKTALEGLLGPLAGGITALRGRWFETQGIPLKATFHPAYLLRNPAAKAPVWEDMKDVLGRLGLPVPTR
jgi:DNA polymerase